MLAIFLAVVMIVGILPTFALAEVTVTSDWYNFRNSEVNMAITDAKTPTGAETTVAKWIKQVATGYTNSPSVQIIVDNALITMTTGKQILKLDLQTGETLASGTLSAATNWGYTPPTYADGLIFCPLSGGTVEAMDAKTLESKWIYNDALKGQSLSAITYSDGYIYTGFWNGEAKDANYVCVNAADGSLVWSKTVAGGFYWAGSVVVGDTLIVGTDDGASGYTGDSHLFALNKANGDVISDITLTGCGDQRSAIAYSKEHGRVYFTTKNGYLCSAKLDAATGVLSDLKTVKQASQSTSTPIVYGDKVYFCAGSGVSSGTGGAGNFVVADAETLEQLYAVALLAYPQGSALMSTAYYETEGKLYFYTTYNGKPGGLSLIKVDPSRNTAEGAELIEIYDAAGYEQFCITSPICGKDGTIYYKNDSGCIFAVGTNNAYLAGLTADAGRQNGDFSASDANIEWVVPIGTETVTLNPTACQGGEATVAGGNSVTLTDGAATASIVVTKDGDTRTYTVTIREISNDNSLSLLRVNESNSFTGSLKTLTPEFAASSYYYGVFNVGSGRTFENVWPVTNDANAAVKVYAMENIRNCALGDEISVTATNSGHDRYAIYFADDSKPMAIRIEVTAENGDIANYYLVMSKEAAAEAGAALLMQLQECKHESTTLTGAKDATCTEAGYTGDYRCDYCGAVVTEGEAVNALGHDWADATCTTPKTCKRCGLTEGSVRHHYENGVCTECGAEDPNYKTAEGTVEVYVTVAKDGGVVMVQRKITAADINHNGVFDVDDVLYAAHETGYTGGAAAGYSSYESSWGLSIGMLWGDTSGSFGYWLNNGSCWSLEDVVADGDHLVAFVYQDSAAWSDAYAGFEKFDYTAEEESPLTVRLDIAGYDDAWNTVFTPHSGAAVTVLDADGKAVEAAVTDNGDGTYTVTLLSAGTYYLVAADSDPLMVPAVCAVTISPKSPETGDGSGIALYGTAIAVSALALAAVLVIDRKRRYCK